MWRHGPQNDPKRSKNHLKRQISQLNDCVSLRMRKREFFGWKTDCGVRILTFWLFEGVRWHFDVKYDVRMLTNDQIELKICMDTYFCPRNANYNILTYRRLWLYIATSDIIRQSKSPLKCYNVIFDITVRLTHQNVKWLEFLHHHSDS